MALKRTAAMAALTIQACPGGCATPLMSDLFACRTCWSRLPPNLRRTVGATPPDLGAEGAARRWFRDHLRDPVIRDWGLHR